MTTIYNRKISFLDNENNRYTIGLNLRDKGSDFIEFFMNHDGPNSLGAQDGGFEPKTDNQQKLLDLTKFHLNSMNVGTLEHEKILLESGLDFSNYQNAPSDLYKSIRKNLFRDIIELCFENGFSIKASDLIDLSNSNNNVTCFKSKYDYEKLYLLSINKLADSEGNVYGMNWYPRELPEDFQDLLDEICDDIEEENSEDEGLILYEVKNKGTEENPEWVFYDSDKNELMNSQGEIMTEDEIRTFFNRKIPGGLQSIYHDEDCAIAIACMFNIPLAKVEDLIVGKDDNRWVIEGVDYLVGTDEEMDEAWDDDIDNYIDECILCNLPKPYRDYFDNERWKKHIKSVDERANYLNRHDGSEKTETVFGETYYAYRQ